MDEKGRARGVKGRLHFGCKPQACLSSFLEKGSVVSMQVIFRLVLIFVGVVKIVISSQ